MATGVSITFAHLSQRNINSMLRATIIAMSLISLIFILVFKSVRLGVISLVPNFVPAAMSFGLWGYLVGQVGLAGSVMTAIAFGIIVDDTTHFLSKYLKARRAGDPCAGSRALHLPYRRSGAMDHYPGPGCGFPGIRVIGIRGKLVAWPDGDGHDPVSLCSLTFSCCRRCYWLSTGRNCDIQTL